MYKIFRSISALFIIPLAVSACATGDSLSQSSASIPAVSQGKSRIVIYRTQLLGAAVQPTISVDGTETDTCQPNKVFYVDVPAGQHTLTAETESKANLVVNANSGASTYVECSVGFGVFIGRPILAIADSATASSTVGKLAFSGRFQVQ